MSKIKNLNENDAAAKIKQMAENAGLCMFCTSLSVQPVATRPMGLAKADDEGNLWFLSPKSSHKNAEIKRDDKVQLFFSKESDSEYLSVYGTATVTDDKAIIDEVWKPIAKAWFKDGKDDPDVSVIKVAPLEAYYWDTKYGKFISLVKIAFAAATGIRSGGGIEGQINP